MTPSTSAGEQGERDVVASANAELLVKKPRDKQLRDSKKDMVRAHPRVLPAGLPPDRGREEERVRLRHEEGVVDLSALTCSG